MKVFSIVSVSLITIVLAFSYIRQLLKKEIKPALAMWVMFSVAVAMSLITYLKEGNYGFSDNILNSVDVIYVVTVSVAIAIWGDHTSKITRFDLGCLVVVGLIIVFWFFTQNHMATNFMIQTILVIAYFPVVKRLIETRKNTEPFLVWTGMMIAPVFSLLSSKGLLATVYSVRAIICVGTLLLIMLWIEFSGRRRNALKEPK
jgi:hypothetical protein